MQPASTSCGSSRATRRARLHAWLAVGFTMSLVTACSGSATSPTTTTTPTVVESVAATDAPTTTEGATGPVNDRLLAEILSEGPTLERATQLFALEVRSMPGVTPPAGEVDPVFSGTYAYMLAARYYDQLTADQQKVLDDMFVQGPDVGDAATIAQFAKPPVLPPLPATTTTEPTTSESTTIEPPTTTTGAAATGDTTTSIGTDTTVAATTTSAVVSGLAAFAPSSPQQNAQLAAYFRPLYEWANNAIQAKTGRPKLLDFQLVFGPLEGTAWAASTTWHDGVRYESDIEQVVVHACHSHIDLAKFANQAVDSQLSVITHEVVHCYQQDASASDLDVSATRPWISEGEATWAQMALVPSASFERLQFHWSEYISGPKLPLFGRAYDAAGFFGHVADVAGDDFMWSKLIPTYLAGDDDGGFATAVAGIEDKVLDTWAASYFRSHTGQFLWDIKGPGKVNMPSTSPAPEEISVPSGVAVSLPSIGSWQLGLVRLQPHADVLMVIVPVGHAAIIDATNKLNKVLTGGKPLVLCLIRSCECPPDEAGEVPPTIPAESPLDIGLTGGRKGSTGWVYASSLSDYCKRKKLPDGPAGPPIPGGGGGGGGGGGQEPNSGKSLADPHLITFDGRWYDLHAVGEFVLARATNTDFEVQARFETRDSRTWSSATMMATKVGNDRVTVGIDLRAARLPVLRVNGEKVDETFRLLDGGSVSRTASNWGDGYVVEFADGTRVGADTTPRGGMTIWVDPPTAMHGKLTGLLGDADGKPANDPVVAGTRTVLSEEPSWDELYGTFAASWRITQGESLFDYGTGETTATFTDNTFPDRDAPVAPPATLAAAHQRCVDAGVTDEHLLASCAFDIAATTDNSFAWAYGSQQLRDDTWRQLTGDGTVSAPTGSTRTKSVVFDGEVATADQKVVKTFEGFKGDVIYIDPTDCQVPHFAELLGPDGEFVGSNTVVCGDRLVLPADGTYQMDMNPFLDQASRFHVPITAVRPDLVRDLRPGDTMSGTIAQGAEHDVFRVKAKAGDSITVGGEGCLGEFDVTVYFGEDELVTAGGACSLGTIEFPKAGTYQFVINAFNGGTGDYNMPTSG